MKCENELCVYESNGECAIKEIAVNSLGMCESCIRATIDEALLERAKRKTLASLNDEEDIGSGL